MSRIFGEVRQIGYVVRDIEAAVNEWTEVFGVGPFFYFEKAPIENFLYMGKPSPVEISAALSFSGRLQIELICQTNDAPSMYLDFLGAGCEGLHHIAYWVEKIDEMMITRITDSGYEIGQAGETRGEGRFFYFVSKKDPGTIIELSEIMGAKAEFYKYIETEAGNWDGNNPVRKMEL